MKRNLRPSLIGLAIASMFADTVARPGICFAEGETQTTGTAPSTPAPQAEKPAKPRKAKAAKKAKPAKKAKAKKAKAKGAKVEGPAVLREYAADYDKPVNKDGERLKTAAGNPIVDSGDEVAVALRGKDLDQVYAVVAKRIGETEKDLRAKYGKLNFGMQRMNLGNRLRGHLNAKAAKAEKKAAKK